MLKQLLYGASALSAPGMGITVLVEALVRPRLFRTGSWCADPPGATGVPYEEARIFTADGLELQGWLFKHERPLATVLFMHGTSYNASDMWATPERAVPFGEFLRGIGCDFLIFDYRGYGRNGGTPTEEGTYTDAAAALAWLHQRNDVDPERIIFYGFSLGTGIAAELATRDSSAGLILRAPFTSVRALMLDRVPCLRPLLSLMPWLPLTSYDTLSKVRHLDRPLLVMHGDSDTTVPEYMGREVFTVASGPKTYVTFPDSGHSDVDVQLLVPAVRRFVEEAVREAGHRSHVTGQASG